MERAAIVLLSGGLDSATTLAWARDQGFDCVALSFDYGQRHAAELAAAARVAAQLGARDHRTVTLDLAAFGGSALTDPAIAVPTAPSAGIPVTYVPARNTIFLSLALGWAEASGARDIYIGANALDYSGYPDCRPEFIDGFARLASLATKAGDGGDGFTVHAPLQYLGKAEIAAEAARLGIDAGLSWSCYDPTPEGLHCGLCDSCRLRRKGFSDAGLPDPTRYAAAP